MSYLISRRTKPDEPDMEFVVLQPKPKSPSGAAGAIAIPELDELQLVRQLLAELCESYRNSNIPESEKKAAVDQAIHILIQGLKKEEPNLKARLVRATYSNNSFHLKRYLSFQSNHFVEMTLDEFREIVSKESDSEV
ncbi:hypothetical protein [Nostoc paludosum]|uniref:hypothetical protein n=1 Tax=Nostoc paludosum TaxID=212362 RepID=UPI0016875C8E|nr:hypothetical protein [Nostoc paludosum]